MTASKPSRWFVAAGLAVVLGLLALLLTTPAGSGVLADDVRADTPLTEASRANTALADTTVPTYDLRAIEHDIHEGINQERTQRGLAPLTYADSLHRLGAVHSRDMAERGFFGHNNPDGEGVNDRADALGRSCVRKLDEQTTARGFGENLYRGTLFNRYQDVFQNGERIRREFDWKTESAIATDVVQGWMDSPGHRANILEERYATEAIALHVDGTDFYVTQVFC